MSLDSLTSVRTALLGELSKKGSNMHQPLSTETQEGTSSLETNRHTKPPTFVIIFGLAAEGLCLNPGLSAFH